MAKLYAPTGNEIIGTLDTVPGIALILDDNVVQNPGGTFEFEYVGETCLNWNGQLVVTRKNKLSHKPERVFVCANNEEWLESQLELRNE